MFENHALYLRITHALHRQAEIVRLAYYIHGSLERGHTGMRLLGRINGRRINGRRINDRRINERRINERRINGRRINDRRAQAECFQGESFLLNRATTLQRLPCLP